jgi:hypothetical protein
LSQMGGAYHLAQFFSLLTLVKSGALRHGAKGAHIGSTVSRAVPGIAVDSNESLL